MVAGCHFWLVGGCRETGIFRHDPPLLSHKLRIDKFSSHKYYSIKIINFTEITVTTTRLTRVLARLIGGGISPCGDVV